LESRRALSAEQRMEYSKAICRRLMELQEIRSAKNVFSYLAAWDEVDLTLLHESLREKGARIAFPVSYKDGIMEAFIPRDENAIEEGAFGIKCPVQSLSEKLMPEDADVVIVPCVGFDAAKNRLGHGGGYYDRYLPKCVKAKFICVAFEAQRLKSLECEAHDIKPDLIITEKTLIL